MTMDSKDKIEILKLATTIAAGEDTRKIFYIDVGGLPFEKAQEYIAKVMEQYRQKMVYNAKTGEVPSSDHWIPRREGGRGTNAEVLPGSPHLDDVMRVAGILEQFVSS